jgi:glucokinase
MNGESRIGIDVGGTKIAAGLVRDNGELDHRTSVRTPAVAGRGAIMSAIADVCALLMARCPGDRPVLGVGVGTSGVVDHRRGRVVCGSANLIGWEGTEVAAELAARVHVPVAVDNDGNTFALAEHRFGAGRNLTDALYITVGTGVGGALILNDQLVRGSHHTAGEVGHFPVLGADLPCSCGGTGHLEAVASGPAMTANYWRQAGGIPAGDLPEIAQRAESGDLLARSVLAHGATALGRALAGMVNILDPQRVVIGGGVATIGDPYWLPLRQAFQADLLPSAALVPLWPAALGTDAGIIGAATLVPGGRTPANTDNEPPPCPQRR